MSAVGFVRGGGGSVYVRYVATNLRTSYTYTEDSRERPEHIVTPVAPDGPRQGLVPARRASMPLALFFSPLTGRGRGAWSDEGWSLRNVAKKHNGKLRQRSHWTSVAPSGSAIQAGLQRLWLERYNTFRYDEGTL
jgi:hypothetical protein